MSGVAGGRASVERLSMASLTASCKTAAGDSACIEDGGPISIIIRIMGRIRRPELDTMHSKGHILYSGSKEKGLTEGPKGATLT